MDINAKSLGILHSDSLLPVFNEADIIKCLANPIGENRRISDIIQPGEKTCFVVSDYTRKTAIDRVLPLVINDLINSGCSPNDFSILIASGIHRPPTSDEIRTIIGDSVFDLLSGNITAHNPDDEDMLVSVGKTRRGHDVRINRLAAEARRLILTGAATYHYHAGFGGGRKSLVPGLASRDTIAHNHSLTLDPDSDQIHPMVQPGIMDGNPVAEEMMECAMLRPPDFIINTVLDSLGRLTGVFAGDMTAAHAEACRLVEKLCKVNISEKADIVIASAGSAPNWIQSHKALFNASRAVKPDGVIILSAPCPEGIGDDRFKYWIKKESLNEIYNELRKSPEILGQTALSTRIRGKQTILVSASKDIAELGITTAASDELALKSAINRMRTHTGKETRNITFYEMPEASYTVPF